MDWIDFKIEGEETKFDLELPTFTLTTQQFQHNFSLNLKPYSVKPLTSFAQLEPSKSSSGPPPPGAGGGGGGGGPRPPPTPGVPSRGAGGSPGGGGGAAAALVSPPTSLGARPLAAATGRLPRGSNRAPSPTTPGASAAPLVGASGKYLRPTPSSPSRITRVGINNTGNTCFYNAMLQLLWDMKPLKEFFFLLRRDKIKSLEPLIKDYLGDLSLEDATRDNIEELKKKSFFKNYPELIEFRQSITRCFTPTFKNKTDVTPGNKIKGIESLNNPSFYKDLLLGLKEYFESYSKSVKSGNTRNALNPSLIKIEKLGLVTSQEEEKEQEEERGEKHSEEERQIQMAIAASTGGELELTSENKRLLESELKGNTMSLPVLFYFYIRNKEPDFVYGYQTDTSIFFQILYDTLSCFLMDREIYNVWKTFIFGQIETLSYGDNNERSGLSSLSSILSIQLLSKESTIQELIDNYQTREKMTEGNMPNTGETHKKQTLLIFKETRNIVIQLKRFGTIGEGEDFSADKIRTRVIPNPIIIIKEVQFKLIGCCVHLGHSINSGHYTYITFDENGKEFSTVNDSLEQINGTKGYQPNQYLENGYIYLYERLNTA